MSQIHNIQYNTSRENGKIGGKSDSEPVRKKSIQNTNKNGIRKKLKSIQNTTNKNGKKLGVPDGKNVKVMKVIKEPDGKLMCQLCETIFDAMNDVVKHMPNCAKLDSAKGQLISTFPFGVFKSPPKTSKFAYGFLP